MLMADTSFSPVGLSCWTLIYSEQQSSSGAIAIRQDSYSASGILQDSWWGQYSALPSTMIIEATPPLFTHEIAVYFTQDRTTTTVRRDFPAPTILASLPTIPGVHRVAGINLGPDHGVRLYFTAGGSIKEYALSEQDNIPMPDLTREGTIEAGSPVSVVSCLQPSRRIVSPSFID